MIYPPDSKVRGANMGPTWVLSAPERPHVGPMNLVISAVTSLLWMRKTSPCHDVIMILHRWCTLSTAVVMDTRPVLLILPLVLMTALGQTDIDYFCPADLNCRCTTLNQTTSLVQLVCHPMILSSWVYPMTLIPSRLTTWLTFICQWSSAGLLQGRDFQYLTGFTEFRIYSCQLPAIPDDTFYGLTNLRTLIMQGIGAPSINQTFLDASPNIENLDMNPNWMDFVNYKSIYSAGDII